MPHPTQQPPARRVAAHNIAQIRNVRDRLTAERGQQLVRPPQGTRARAADRAIGEVLAHRLGDIGWQLTGQLGDEQLWVERTLEHLDVTPVRMNPLDAYG